MKVYNYKTNKWISDGSAEPYKNGLAIFDWDSDIAGNGYPGVYKIKVESVDDWDNDYVIDSSSKSTAKVTINKCNLKISAKKLKVPKKSKTKFKIKLTGPNKRSVANVAIILKIFTGSKHKTVYLQTNSKGIATYKVSKLSVGKHKVKISWIMSGIMKIVITAYMQKELPLILLLLNLQQNQIKYLKEL